MAEAASVSLFGGAAGRERRANRRKSLLDTSLVTVDLNPGAYGLMLDVSEAGAKVQAMGPVEPGAKVQIAFEIPELSKRIEGIGCIKWADDEGRVGVQFESLKDPYTEDLKRWIDSLPREEEASLVAPESPAPALDFSEYVTDIPGELRAADADVDSILQFLIEKVVERTHANGSAIAVGTPDDMVCRASSGVAPEIGTRISSDSSLSAECLRTGKIVKCDDTETDPRVSPDICRQLNLRSLLIVPLLHRGQVRGLLEVFSPVPQSFDAEHVALLQDLVDFASEILFAPEAVNSSTQKTSEQTELTLSIDSIASLGSTEEIFTLEDLAPPQPEAPALVPSQSGAAAEPAPIPVYEDRPKPVNRAIQPKREASAAATATQSPKWSKKAHVEPEAHSQTHRSILAVGLVVVLLTALAGAGWWYGVRVSRRTAPPPTPTAAMTQAPPQAPPQTEQQPISVPAAAVTETVRPKTTRSERTNTDEAAEDTVRSHGQEPRQVGSPLVISPAAGPAKRPEDGSIVAPSLANLNTNQNVGSVHLPAYSATPALKAPSTVSGGQLLQRVEPTYPSFARQQRYQGDVVLNMRISKTGTVENVRRVSGNPMLSAAAVDAVKKWRYEPYRLNGQPQEIETTVTIKFKLPY
jgi:TonB family protein